MNPIRNKATEKLFSAILTLDNIEECFHFFEDLCTIKELDDISQRFCVAEMLSEGKNYQEISRETGASTATISRVNRCLSYGDGGYRTVLQKLKSEENKK